ncbi:MAG: FAD-dependent monooxygenase [Frankiaceae bacterium]|nr:FAD-dependent monooxygenase [Frankiaceae bacterium]
MPSGRIAVLGGGPAGLAVAQLLKRQQPALQVTLFERQAPDSTFGYGVGLGWKALAGLTAASPSCVADLERASRELKRWTICSGDASISAHNSHGLAISRQVLLEVLREHAVQAGVDIRAGVHVTLDDVVDADVIIAADGVGSETRARLAPQLGVTATRGELAYLWCGAEIARDEMTLALTRTPAGPMVAHVMPYSDSASTFQVDAMQDTLGSLSDVGGSSLAYLESTFSGLLGGTPLRAKRPVWQVFETVKCERWSTGNVVLLGDAAHTAHYTVGSGTGLAIEDAACLAEALVGGGSPADAFEAYATARQPRVHRLQERAARSELWWSSLALRMDNPLPQLLLSYLSRTGAVPLAAIASDNADLVRQCLPGADGGDLTAAILATPFEEHPHRVVTAPDAATLVVDSTPTLDSLRATVEQVRDLAATGTTLVRLTGAPGADAVLDRLDLAEHIRAGAKLPTVVAGTESTRDTLALGVLTGRTDLVEIC